MQVIYAILGTIVLFSLLVFIHEGGHFLTSRMFGVRAPEFMIGLPGPNIGFTRKGTKYGITAIPLGGYVKIAGMEPGPEDPLLAPTLDALAHEPSLTASQLAGKLDITEERAYEVLEVALSWDVVTREDPKRSEQGANGEVAEPHYIMRDEFREAPSEKERLDTARKGTYRGLSFPKRLVVLCAGVVINILAAVLIVVAALSLYGVEQPSTTTVVGEITQGSPAAAAGLVAGDKIISVDGKNVDTWDAAVSQIKSGTIGDAITLVVDHEGTPETLSITTTAHPQDSSIPFIGISPTLVRERMGFGDALKAGGEQVVMTAKGVAGLFNPSTFKYTIDNSSSIVGIAAMTGEVVQQGFMPFIMLLALISLSLGLMNILPIPPLDGGKVIIEIGQRITRRDFSAKVQGMISVVGISLLLLLFVYVTGSDIIKLVTGAFPWQ